MSSTLAITNQNIRRLTIVVSVVQAVGHVNACIGALTELLARGHRIIFVLTKIYEGKAAKHGYEEHVFQINSMKEDQTKLDNPGQIFAKLLLDNRIIGPNNPMEKMRNIVKLFVGPEMLNEYRLYDLEIKKVINLYKPDLFYIDGDLSPSIYYSNIPWIKNSSCQPLFYRFDPDLQPGCGGK